MGGPFQILTKIIIPNLIPDILSSSLLVFLTVFAKFILTTLIVGAGFKVLTLLLIKFKRICGKIAAAFSVISFTIAWLVSIHIIWIRSKTQVISSEALRAQ